MTIIRLTTCNDVIEANFIKDKLVNENIDCFLTNENFTTLMPGCNGMLGAGIQVMIDESDMEKAQELIYPQSKENKIVCPNCNSTNVQFGLGANKVKKLFIVLISLLATVPFGNVKNTYCCQDCKTEFRM